MKRQYIKLYFFISMAFIFMVNTLQADFCKGFAGCCGAVHPESFYWTPETASDWTSGGDGYSSLSVSSNGSCVQITAPDGSTSANLACWFIEIYYEGEKGPEGFEFTLMPWGFFQDSIEDGYFSMGYSVEPFSGPFAWGELPPPSSGDMPITEEFQAFTDVEFTPLMQMNATTWKASASYENSANQILSKTNSTWFIEFVDETHTRVKIFNNYTFKETWSGYGTTEDDEFYMAESCSYVYASESNDIPSYMDGGDGQYVTDTNKTTYLGAISELKALGGYPFGVMEIAGTYNVTKQKGLETINENGNITASKSCIKSVYNIEGGGTLQFVDSFAITMMNLTSNDAAGHITNLWYDPQVTLAHKSTSSMARDGNGGLPGYPLVLLGIGSLLGIAILIRKIKIIIK